MVNKEIIIQGGRRIDLECEFSIDGIISGEMIKRRFKFDPGAQNTCIAASDIDDELTEEGFIKEFKPQYRFIATGIDDESEITYYPIMVDDFYIEEVRLGSVPIFITFDERFSKRLLGLNLLNLINYEVNNDMRIIRLSQTQRLREHIENGVPITTEEMIKMGLYDPRFDLDHIESI